MNQHLDLEYVAKITAKKQMKLETNHKIKLGDLLLYNRHFLYLNR